MRTSVFSIILAGCLLGAAGSSSCGGKATEAMTDDLCRCMQPMAEAYAALERTAASGAPEELQRRLAEMDSITADADRCMDELEAKYGNALEHSEEAIRAQMARRCPEVARVMDAAESEVH